jgi:hypothetical protein
MKWSIKFNMCLWYWITSLKPIDNVNKRITHLFFNLLISYCFCFHWFTFSKHLLFWYLTTCCDGSDYINWYIIKFRRFHHYSSSSGWFSSKHVLNLFFLGQCGALSSATLVEIIGIVGSFFSCCNRFFF